MLLRELREQLQSAGELPLLELAERNGLALSQLLTLLQPWLARGRVQLLQAPPSCGGGCSGCVSVCTETRRVRWLA